MQPQPQPAAAALDERSARRRLQGVNATTEEAPKTLDFAWFAIGVVLCLVGTPLCIFAARTWAPKYSDADRPGSGAPDKDQESEDGQAAGEEAEAEDDGDRDVENPLGAQVTS